MAGSGKSTIGKALAERLRWQFFDGDDFHTSTNRQKMAAGQPLTDADREPWLDKLNGLLERELAAGHSVVLACSALKEKHGSQLTAGLENVMFVYLKGDVETVRTRMEARSDHFMKPGMLESQFADLEEPTNAININITQPIELIVEQIVRTRDQKSAARDFNSWLLNPILL